MTAWMSTASIRMRDTGSPPFEGAGPGPGGTRGSPPGPEAKGSGVGVGTFAEAVEAEAVLLADRAALATDPHRDRDVPGPAAGLTRGRFDLCGVGFFGGLVVVRLVAMAVVPSGSGHGRG